MFRRIAFYFSMAAALIVGVTLALLASSVFLKKPVKPVVTPQAVVEKPPIVEKKVSSLPVEERPTIEEKAPVTTEVPPAEKEKALKPEFHKGMAYVAWTESGYSNVNSVKAMEQMSSLGVEWVGLLATWYQDKYNSTKIYPQMDKSPSDESLIFAIRKLHELKLKVMLKPHLDLLISEGKWRGEIGCDNPGDWQAWFDSYTAFILHYADIATKENVELLCIGTELSNATVSQPEHWRDLIRKVREVYKGQLTYAANWDNEFSQITFWDALDYAGIDPYFPMVCSYKPNVEQLKSVWADWLKDIEPWQRKIDKPVIFTEIGYKSCTDAFDEPWQQNCRGELDLEAQANGYEALLESFWDKPWFYGVYWWCWGVNPRMGGELNRGFTPQNKPAQNVIKDWYSKPISQRAY